MKEIFIIWFLGWVAFSGYLAHSKTSACGFITAKDAMDIVEVSAIWPSLVAIGVFGTIEKFTGFGCEIENKLAKEDTK